MALTWRYNRARPGPPAGIVWAQAANGQMPGVTAEELTTNHEIVWHDDADAVLHPELEAQANLLEKQADELRRQARESHDTIPLPAKLSPSELQDRLREIAKGKLAALKANLGRD